MFGIYDSKTSTWWIGANEWHHDKTKAVTYGTYADALAVIEIYLHYGKPRLV